MGIILSGKDIADRLRQRIREDVAEMNSGCRAPVLAVVIAGNDQASIYYAELLQRAGEKEGINVSIRHLKDSDTAELTDLIGTLNNNPEVDGVLVQLPLPEGIGKNEVFNVLSPDKDADGQTPFNLGLLLTGQNCIVPATARAVVKIIKENNIEIAGKRVVIVGRSTTAGLPAALLLTGENATVTICHSMSRPLENYTSDADILVVSAGSPRLIKSGHVKEGAVVVDVGTNEVEGKMVGDVDYEDVIKKASAVSPVTGGVGAVTLACLFENTVELYRKNLFSIRS